MNVHAECNHFRDNHPGFTSDRQRTYCMSTIHSAQDQCSDIEYDVMNLDNLHVRDTYTSQCGIGYV
jgi:hypothetical protein